MTKLKPKDGIYILTDYLHWIGWFLSSVILTVSFIVITNIFGVDLLYVPMYKILVIFLVTLGVVVSVDVFKHLTNLQ